MTCHEPNARPVTVVAVLACLCAITASAQDPGRRRRPDGSAPEVDRRLTEMDRNRDGRISKDEFAGPQRIFNRLDVDGDGWLTMAEARASRRRFAGGDSAPRAGEPAPTFTLKSRDGKRSFDLTAHKGKRPVVLFFGSYT